MGRLNNPNFRPDKDAPTASVSDMMAELNAIANAQGITWSGAEITGSVAPERTRYATPGQQCGRGRVRLLSPKQVAYIRRLMAERGTSNLVRLPGSEDLEYMSLKGASDLIERLLACPVKPVAASGQSAPVRLATEPMQRFIRSLCAQKGADVPNFETLSFNAARSLIDTLKAAPNAAPAQVKPELEAGIYLLNDTVYKVQKAVHGSKRMYAKELSKDTGKFEYASGAVSRLSPEHRMSLAQAKAYGAVYGVCCNCGRTLTDEASIEASIGPVCAKKF